MGRPRLTAGGYVQEGVSDNGQTRPDNVRVVDRGAQHDDRTMAAARAMGVHGAVAAGSVDGVHLRIHCDVRRHGARSARMHGGIAAQQRAHRRRMRRGQRLPEGEQDPAERCGVDERSGAWKHDGAMLHTPPPPRNVCPAHSLLRHGPNPHSARIAEVGATSACAPSAVANHNAPVSAMRIGTPPISERVPRKCLAQQSSCTAEPTRGRSTSHSRRTRPGQ